jgi:hypothetical protein
LERRFPKKHDHRSSKRPSEVDIRNLESCNDSRWIGVFEKGPREVEVGIANRWAGT